MKNFKKLVRIVTLFVIFSSALFVNAQLSGTYTIGSSGTYSSFTAAVTALTTNGVSGPVTFNVASGTYTEQIAIPSITGSSTTNTITFQSSTGDSTDVNLTFASSTSSTNNYTLLLNGADYITFKSMTISRTGSSTYSVVISLIGGASINQFLNNRIIGREYISSSTNNALFYATSAAVDEKNLIRNNLFKFGTYGLYFGGSSSTYERGNQIIDNVFDSFGYYGVKTDYQNGVKVNENILNAHPGAGTAYGLYINYCHKNVEVLNNNMDIKGTSNNYGIYMYYSDSGSVIKGNMLYMHGSSTTYGIYVYYNDGTSSNHVLVANNFITQTTGTGSVYGIYPYNCYYVDVIYNSVNVTGGSTTAGRALYLNSSTSGTYGNIKVLNNNLSNTGGGYSIEISSGAVTLGYVISCNYNNLYATGTNLGMYSGTTCSSFSNWKSTSSLDGNSLNVDPAYTSVTDLHTTATALDKAATPFSDVPYDIDGETRNSTTPDIGADEFTVSGNDAGIVSFESGSSCSGSVLDIQVRVKNYGTSDIDSVEIHWSVNDTVKTTYKSKSKIAVGNDLVVKIGQFTFYKGIKYKLVFWTEKPNGKTDGKLSNDTFAIAAYITAMKGTYLIGSSTGTYYSKISDAVNDLISAGVCAPVIFNIQSGTYNEQFVIPEILGASSSNTITFQSVAGDSSKVIISQASSSASTNNYTVKLDGADYLIFKNLTFSRTGADAYCNIVEVTNNSCNNLFSHNQFLGGSYSATSATSTRSCIYSSSINDTNNIFEFNYFKDNGYAMYYYGSGSSSLESGTIIRHNVFKDQIYGIYLYYQNSPKIYGNTIDFSTSATCYPIRTSYCDYELEIYNNKITNNNGNGGNGIYVYYCDADTLKEALIYNNFVHLNTSGSTAYGLYPYYGSHQKYYFNTVNITGSLTTSRAFYVYGSSAHHIYTKNNNLINNAGGYAYYKYATSTVVESDFNNLYTNGTILAYWGSDYTNLSSLQTASGMDKYSVSVKTSFVSTTDLHTYSVGIDGLATPISGITSDIDGETRNSSKPDIGADEFDPPANDLKVVSVIAPVNGCGDSNSVISVVVKNSGTSTKTSIPVKVEISGSANANITQSFSKTLVTGQSDTFSFTSTLNTYGGGTFNFVAYTQLSGDQIPENDTIKYSVTIEAIPAAPTTKSVTICSTGSDSLTATAASGLTIDWYDSPTSGKLVHTGNSFTPSVATTTTFYAEATGAVSYTFGPKDNSIGTTGNFTDPSVQGMYFTVYKTIVLDSLVVYPYSSGNVVVRLRDASNTTTINSVSRSVTAGGKTTIYVGMNISPGSYRIDGGGSSTAGLSRNSTGGSYPYEISNVVSITGNSFDANYYYYFYNWQVTTYGCPSPRTAATITVIPLPNIDAGMDDTNCINSSYSLKATASDYGSLLWTTSGDGSFSSKNTLSTVYTSGTSDNNKGSVKLYLEGKGNSPCGSVIDSMVLTIKQLPEALTGIDVTICEDATYLSTASANNYDSLKWSSLGDGTFDNASKIDAVYTPGSNDISSGSVNLILDAMSDCGNDYDTIVVNFSLLPIANAGKDDSLCANAIYTLKGSASNYDSIYWTSLGDGTFSNANSLTSDYIPGTTDINKGKVTLVLNTTAQTPCSTGSFDSITIFIIPIPNSNAGNDASICEDKTYILNGLASNYSIITWTTTGDGNFSNINSLNAVYTPGINDISNLSVNLILSASPNIPCTNSFIDTMTLTIIPNAIVEAGNDDTICSSDVANLVGNASNFNSVTWSTSGDGSFSNSTGLVSDYSPGSNDVVNGMVKLFISVKPNSPCSTDAIDSLILYFENPATVNAGLDDTICAIDTASITATASNYISINWKSMGDGSFGNSNLLSTTYSPGTNDLINGSVKLVFEATGITPCGNTFDTVEIKFVYPSLINVKNPDSICAGETFSPMAIASNYVSLLWTSKGDGSFDANNVLNPEYTPGATDISSGKTNLTITANNNNECGDVSKDIDLNIYPIPSIYLGKDTTIYSHRTIKLDAGTGFDKYSWSTNESTQSIKVDSIGAIAGKKAIWLKVTKNGCNNSDTIVISFKDSTSSIGELPNLKYSIYPNPTRGKLMIKANGETDNLNIQLMTLEGKMLLNKSIRSEQGIIFEELDLSQFAKGVYLIMLKNEKGFKVERLILE